MASETIGDDYQFSVNVPALFNKDLTAPNVLYGLTAGDNITISVGQSPTISAVVPDQTTDLKIFGNLKVGSTTINAGSKTDTFELAAGSNISLSTSDKKITIANSYSAPLGTSVDLASEITGLLPLANLTTGSENQILVVSAGVPAWTSNPSGGSSGVFGFLQRNSGVLSSANITDDLAIGGIATASALLQISGTTGRFLSSLIPETGSLYDLGSSARRWATVYGDTGNFTNFSSSTTTISGTTASDFLINTDNATADTENASLTFERGTPATNVQFKWDASNKILSANSPTFGILGDTGIAYSGQAALVINQIQSQDILTASASGTTRFTLDTSGNIKTATWQGAGIGAIYGGTGQTTWTTGDLLYASGTNALSKLGIGSTGQLLSVSAGLPAWAASSGSNWQRNLGVLAPLNITDDVLVGDTATASAKVRLSGTTGDINFTGKLLEDGNEVLANMIAPFAAACPTGWTEYTSARGRYVVGTPLSGTIAGTDGTALTNLEDRPTGQHLHSVDPPSTSVSISDPGHTHSVNAYSPADGGGGSGTAMAQGGNPASAASNTTGISATVNIAAFNSANAGSVTGTNAPYIQLTYCQKTAGADLAEWIPASENIGAETIVSADPDKPESVTASNIPYDYKVLGVVSSKPGWLIGDQAPGSVQLALAGRVPTRVSLKNGDIKIGDPITTSDIAGVGMKATKPGWIVGKAMQNLSGDTNTIGTITVFLSPTWQDGGGEESLQTALLTDSSWQVATASGKLMTALAVQVPELTVTGKLHIGLLTFDDIGASISSVTGTVTVAGDLAVEKSIKVLGASAGKAVIPVGQTLISIISSLVSTQSAIFVSSEDPQVMGAKATEPGKFVISIPASLPADLKVNWWIVN